MTHRRISETRDRSTGQTLLQKAAFMGLVKFCATLLHCGADVDTQDSGGDTALHYAVMVSMCMRGLYHVFSVCVVYVWYLVRM